MQLVNSLNHRRSEAKIHGDGRFSLEKNLVLPNIFVNTDVQKTNMIAIDLKQGRGTYLLSRAT